MSRLFAGTPWDRPPLCEQCGKLESECVCPPVSEFAEIAPEQAGTARLRLEKRSKGKLVTVVAGLQFGESQRETLAATLKDRCGAGGTTKDEQIELQGDLVDRAEKVLKSLGYRTKRA